jgi:hypothetical protein
VLDLELELAMIRDPISPHRRLTAGMRRTALLAACMIAIACDAPVPPAPSSPSAATAPASETGNPAQNATEHRIGVRLVKGTGQLYDRQTGTAFTPRGFNLIRLAGGHHSTLSVGHYDPDATERAFARMQAGGYNTVRLFLDTYPGGLPGTATPLSDEFMDNATDFLARAAAHDIQVLFTTDWLPEGNSNAYAFETDPLIDNVNSLYLSKGGVAANERFFADFARGLIERGARLDALLAYELRNELYFSDKYGPFALKKGKVTTANGKSYDMASAKDKNRIIEENLVFWIDRMRAAIVAVDPTALVTIGFFQPKGPNTSRVGDDRLIETRAAILRSTADFIDLHGYPGGDLNLRQIVENFKLPKATAKPILLGEFGAEHRAYATIDDAVRTLVQWQVESCSYGFDGWLVWTWDALEQPEFWNALDKNGAIEHAFAPAVRPNPCTIGKLAVKTELTRGATATASSALPGRPARNAIDGLFETIWNARALSPQWISIDLRAARTVEQIRLQVAQDPAGPSRHVVWVRSTSGNWRQVHVFRKTTREGEWLTYRPTTPLKGIRYVRVETTALGSLWPAWHEISILGH